MTGYLLAILPTLTGTRDMASVYYVVETGRYR